MLFFTLHSSPFTQRDDLTIREAGAVDGEPDKGALLLPSLNAGSTRIDVQQAQGLVILYFENVGMAADEQLGRIGIYLS